jgi:hypothetical protein
MSCRRAISCRLLAIGLTLMVAGCGYGELSPTAYQYAKALYGLSNRQAGERVEAVRVQIESARTAKEITPREAGWLIDIVDDCEKGRWKTANKSARRMMEDQVRR